MGFLGVLGLIGFGCFFEGLQGFTFTNVQEAVQEVGTGQEEDVRQQAGLCWVKWFRGLKRV